MEAREHAGGLNLKRAGSATSILLPEEHNFDYRRLSSLSEGLEGDVQSRTGSKEAGLGVEGSESGEESVTHRILAGIQEILSSQLRLERQLKSARDPEECESASILSLRPGACGSEGRRRTTLRSRSMIGGLPQSWPALVGIRHEVESLDSPLRSSNTSQETELERSGSASFQPTVSQQRSSLVRSTSRSNAWRSCPPLPMHPNGNLCVCWDFLGFVVLLHDIFFTPILVAWDVGMSNVLGSLSLLSTAYWALACLLEFQTGFYHQGELNTNRRAITRRYLRSWFSLDACLCTSDLVGAILTTLGNGNSEFTLALIRVSKICRLMKIVRLVRMSRVLNKMTSWFITTRWQLCALQAAKVVVSLLIYNHCVCCAWYVTGKSARGTSWLHQLETGNMLYEYLTSYHWAIAQMTPGPINIVASNSAERAFNCCLLVMGMLFGSCIVSMVTGQIMQLIILQRDKMQKLETLRGFLRQNAIRSHLSYCVQRHVEQRLGPGKFLEESQVPALQLLSMQLRQDLTFASRSPHLILHPLFLAWDTVDGDVLRGVCLGATDSVSLTAQEQLFISGVPISAMYFLMHGQALYTQKPEHSRVRDDVATTVPLKAWICEVALWSNWHAVGSLEAVVECHFIIIEACGLYTTILEFPNVCDMTKHYAQAFHLRIVSAVPPQAAWPNELEVPFTAGTDLLSAQVGIRTLRAARQCGRFGFSDEVMEELEDEVRTERCAVERTPEGEVQRTVAVVALRLCRSDGRFLAQLGHWDARAGPKLGVMLLGKKRRIGELPQAAFQRVLSEVLPCIQSLVALDHIDLETERRQSERYRMATVYTRTVHTCFLDESRPLQPLLPTWLPDGASEPPIQMHLVPRKRGHFLYGWLTESEFAYYSSPAGGEEVKKWLEQMDPLGRFTPLDNCEEREVLETDAGAQDPYSSAGSFGSRGDEPCKSESSELCV